MISIAGLIVGLCLVTAPGDGPAPSAIDYSRDVRPILAASCLGCHGPKKQKGGLALHDRAAALAGGDDGGDIVPGKGAESRIVRYASGLDDDHVMPPEGSGDRLSPAQVAILRDWIDQGATWPEDSITGSDRSDHWAFRRPERPSLPAVKDPSWPRNEVDRFVLARLESEGLRPSPEADRATLNRRASLDLIGLPPTIAEVDAFLADDRPDAYERLVDRLIASPHYGERWARKWLDGARYADTNGYEKDRERSIWPYRDWVIRALNADLPFDRFTIEQIAGDLLPDPTIDQRVATGFHRNTMINEEGGIDVAEFRFASMVDRVATTGAVWLGITVQCAQCHTHKYDPITQRDYYRLFAFLDNADEPDLTLPDPAIAARRASIEAKIQALEAGLAGRFPADDAPVADQPSHDDSTPVEERRAARLARKADEWERSLRPTRWEIRTPAAARSARGATLRTLDDHSVLAAGDKPNNDTYEVEIFLEGQAVTAIRLEVLPDPSLPDDGPGRAPLFSVGNFLLSEVQARIASADGKSDLPLPLGQASADFHEAGRDPAFAIDGRPDTGWSVGGAIGQPHAIVLRPARPIEAGTAGRLILSLHQTYIHQMTIGRFRVSTTADPDPPAASGLPAEVEAIATLAPSDRTPDQSALLRRHFLATTPELASAHSEIAALRRSLPTYPTSMVMEERPTSEARTTRVRRRGEFLQATEAVTPAVPPVLHPLPAGSKPDRLALARWLVAEDNPLVGRVVMNRAWQTFFGRGIVSTIEDFGVRGAKPTHPELLDWLATELPRSGWSMKAMHRLIATSATYRQSSKATPEATAADPLNERLARGPRFRVDGEVIRDGALRAAGLLDGRLGGPSVYPPQPDGVSSLAYGQAGWPTSSGPDRYRRGLYTFTKRTAPFAASATFDAPSPEIACVRRERSNTPLQALTLLNDPALLEAARAMGRRIVAEGPLDPEGRATLAYRLALGRSPTADEVALLVRFQAVQARRIRDGELDPRSINGKAADASDPELAAWAIAARALLNLDEAITKE